MKILLTLIVTTLFYLPGALANSIGSDAQNFNPVSNGLDFVTVHSSNTLEPGLLNIGLFTNYAVNTLPFINIGSTTSPQKANVNDSFWQGELNLALGLFKDFDIGVSLPYLIKGTVDQSANLGLFENSGLTDIRVRMKYRLFKGVDWGLALIGSVNFNQIFNNPFIGDGGGPIYNIEAAIDKMFGKVLVGFNVGYRIRNAGTAFPNTGIDPYPDQVVASLAASYYMSSWDSNLIAELYSSNATKSIPNLTERELSALELLLGIKHDWTTRFSSHFGAAAGLTRGTSTPDWRVYAGLNYVVGPLWGGDEEGEIEPEPEPVMTPEERKKVKYVRFILRKIRFIFNTTDFTDETFPVLERLSRYLKTYKKIHHLIVEGHTDAVGGESYNLELSQNRAEKVKEYIIQNMVTPIDRIEAVGYGESRPLASNSNFQGRAHNRRVELRIFGRKYDKMKKETIKQEE